MSRPDPGGEALFEPAGPDGDEVIYGRHPVLEALRAGEALAEVVIAEGAHGDIVGQIARLARERNVTVRHAPRPALDRLARGTVHQGVAARVAASSYVDVAEILAVAIRRGEAPFVVVLDQIQDVHNLGALIRTAEAAGAHGLILADRFAVGITAAVRKASGGAVAHLAVARTDLAEALDTLKAAGLRIVGLAMDGETDWATADLTGPLALVVGSEGRGMRAAVARRCDLAVRLPMRGRVASLNAAVAGAIVVYEAVRQRGADASPDGPADGPPESPSDDATPHP
ncbi:MAG: 23S rRNA (guanosine(2251)-2'-O)-methyltransferase RlmB [Ardenticatenales bacterium]